MMGRQIANKERLTAFSVDDYVPANHLLRQIDRFLELSALRQSLSGYYSAKGRPSIDPELMIRMLIIGYCYGIRSERRLCEEVHLNLAYRWFCRLGLKGSVPEHSTFSKNRHGRFRDSDAFRQLFETVLARCIAEGVVAGEGFAVDASTIAADASSSRSRSSDGNPDDWHDGSDLSRPVREYLCALEQANPRAPVTRRISLTDPTARWIGTKSHLPLFAYSTNYLVDLYAGIVVDVEATECARSAEVRPTRLAATTTGASATSISASTSMGAWAISTAKRSSSAPASWTCGRNRVESNSGYATSSGVKAVRSSCRRPMAASIQTSCVSCPAAQTSPARSWPSNTRGRIAGTQPKMTA
jgi:transposase